MKTILPAILLLVSPSVRCAVPSGDPRPEQRDKIESILRMQDLRVPFGPALASLLADADPLVRSRAALACASLQDTAAVGALTVNLADPDSSAATAAAFALGQTGAGLSESGRLALGEDLIRRRIGHSRASGRILEEIGKFGTPAALAGILHLVPEAGPAPYDGDLVMSVARFAIRGISSPEAVRFLLAHVRPGVETSWRVLYALQRTGDAPGTREALGALGMLEHAADPLVRMNLASLLGKVQNAAAPQGILLRMAALDPDWRVRVNALKALSQAQGSPDTAEIGVFHRAFFDANPHTGITAISVFPSVSGRARGMSEGAIGDLARIAENAHGDFSWQVQAEAALALAKIDGRIPRALAPGGSGLRPHLRARLIGAAGESGDTASWRLLSAAAAGRDPLIVSAALEGLRSLAARNPGVRWLVDSTARAAIRSLGTLDMAIVSGAAEILGDSLFRSGVSVEPLLAALDALSPPADAETMQDVIRALGALGDGRASPKLTSLLQSRDLSVAGAAAAALEKITGKDHRGEVARQADRRMPDEDMALLRSLPPLVRVRLLTSRGEIGIELDRDAAPFTTVSIVNLCVHRRFYRGLTFHRVVPNFVVQGGDPRGDGWGGPGYSIRSEFSPVPFGTGTVGIASAGKDTEGSQFFITHSPQPHLDGRYTVVGRVVAGLNVVDMIQVGDTIDDMKIVD